MTGYWHQWHWWGVPAGLALGWLNYRLGRWLVLPDGRWRWQRKKGES